MGCVLRAGSEMFDVDAFLRVSAWKPAAIYHRGKRHFSRQPPSEISGFNLVVSEEDFGERAIEEAIAFLAREKDELARLTREAGRPFTLDFATEYDIEKFPFFSRRFPIELVAAAARAGGQLEISCYPPSIEDVEDGPASNAGRSFLLDALRKKYADHDTTRFGIADFLGAFGSPVDAIMYLRLFWPEFIRFEGMVFRQETLEDEDDRRRVREVLGEYAGNRSRTERTFNIIEVPYGVFSRGGESEDEIDEFLVQNLMELWKYRLAASLPELEFTVEAVSPETNAGERAVTFYARREGEDERAGESG
jgi:hypothetical protein